MYQITKGSPWVPVGWSNNLRCLSVISRSVISIMTRQHLREMALDYEDI